MQEAFVQPSVEVAVPSSAPQQDTSGVSQVQKVEKVGRVHVIGMGASCFQEVVDFMCGDVEGSFQLAELWRSHGTQPAEFHNVFQDIKARWPQYHAERHLNDGGDRSQS